MLRMDNMRAYFLLMRADKPIGIYLLLWPTVWAMLIAAEGLPGLHITLVFIAGVVVMRSAGCVINDYADRHFDGAVKRTANRPLVTGQVSEKEALFLFSTLILIAFLLVLTLNLETILLSIVAVLLASAYPFMKRFTYLPQFVLGAAFGWAIPMAFMAIQTTIPWWVWILYAANLCWTVAYDTMYAMVDRDDDLAIGVKSTAILFGQYDRLVVGILQVLTLALFAWVVFINQMSIWVTLALVATTLLFGYQQWMIRNRDREQCFRAFLNNHYAGLILALGLGGHYLIQ